MKHLKNIDRRIIYMLIILSITIPLFIPINLPVEATDEIIKFHDQIESLKPNDIVFVSFNYSLGAQAELSPQADIVLDHLFSKEVKVIGAAFRSDSLIAMKELFDDKALSHDKLYGVDYVNLGFLLGGETAMANLGKNVYMTAPKDNQGNIISDIEIMQQVKTAADFDLIIDFGSGTPGTPEMIRQLVDPYNIPYIAGLQSVSVVGNLPYYASGQMDGYLNSLVGAAGYEKLMGVSGVATAIMNPLSASVIVVLLFIILGNITYLIEKNRSRGVEK